VAAILGAVRVEPSTTDAGERKLRNVVEEMSIASGIPVPEIYLLKGERSINAFAAGFAPGDAVIGVTSGALTELTRDELQGVVAHEFSHILNGDMRLNLRLMGLLHGILLIGLTGYWLLRSGGRGNRKGNGPVLLAGLAFLIIGYIGVFFGKLIQAAVSRQREFLADASAVQFTRNPNGIAGALKKIGRVTEGSLLVDRHAGEVSHMTFGPSIPARFTALLATHPPLDERIRAIEPSFRGGAADARESPQRDGIEASSLLASVGEPTQAHLDAAASTVGALPESLRLAIQDPLGARSLVYALLLNASDDISRGMEILQARDPSAHERTLSARSELALAGERNRLALIDLALPALRSLSRPAVLSFRSTIEEMIRADEKMTLFEFMVVKLLTRSLQAHGGIPNRGKVRFRTIEPIVPDAAVLLSCLAYTGTDREDLHRTSFQKGMGHLTAEELPLLARDRCDIAALHRSLERLSASAPLVKRDVLEAAAATVGADGKLSWREAELLRTVGTALDSPVPPALSM
jgi:Zn-dependent protease with chaperone function